MSLESKIAVVTGASRGIGLAISTALAAQGAFVIGTATSEPGANSISERLAGKGIGYVNADDIKTLQLERRCRNDL